jgi:dTDP-4-dehydrorhamnose reductase
MKIAIIGARGMLGRDLCRVLKRDHDLLAWDIDEIDITDRAQTIDSLAAESPDSIINAAAFVDMEGCEANPDVAWQVNAVGAQNLALAAAGIDSELVYISSDYIFDGTSAADYDETAGPNPLNQYGKSKLAGEQLSLQNCRRTYSVRTAWLFGHAANNYVERVLMAADTEAVIRMPDDQVESPTYTIHLAEAINHLIPIRKYGIYNVTSIGGCTRFEFAQCVMEETSRSERVERVDPKTIQRTTPRPVRSVLDCRLFQSVTGHKLSPWRKGVRDYFSNLSQWEST